MRSTHWPTGPSTHEYMLTMCPIHNGQTIVTSASSKQFLTLCDEVPYHHILSGCGYNGIRHVQTHTGPSCICAIHTWLRCYQHRATFFLTFKCGKKFEPCTDLYISSHAKSRKRVCLAHDCPPTEEVLGTLLLIRGVPEL